MMKIFISWSGDRSKAIAQALKVWLKDVVSDFQPWISSEDIEAGARWAVDLAIQLQNTDVGIICLTPENIEEPWILFEAGALAKTVDSSRICTFLFQLTPRQLRGPLVQFQATEISDTSVLKLLKTLNNRLGEHSRPADQLDRAFRTWWPGLEKTLNGILRVMPGQRAQRSDRELLEELIDLTRQQAKDRAMSALQQVSRWVSFESLFDDIEARDFAKSARLSGSQEDANADQWATDIQQLDDRALDGVWASRWNRVGSSEVWHTGVASVVSHGPYVVILHTDPEYKYFMLTKRDSDGRLYGKHYNLDSMKDNSPWVGLVVDNQRVDGIWSQGRWDLRRRNQP